MHTAYQKQMKKKQLFMASPSASVECMQPAYFSIARALGLVEEFSRRKMTGDFI